MPASRRKKADPAAEAADRERAERELAEIQARSDREAEIEAFENENGRPPTTDELAERRAAKATAEADRALEAEMGGHAGGGPLVGEDGYLAGERPLEQPGSSSIAERAASGEQIGEEEDGQLFVWEQGRKVSLGTLIPRGVDVSHHFVFRGKRIKAKGELQALDAKSLLLVQGLSGGTHAVPTHDEDEKVTSVAVESIVQTKTVTAIESQPVEALAMLRPVLDRLGYDIVERPAQATG